MSFGFIIIRHVNNKITDLYWKICYQSIRKLYSEPIIIIDDSSDTTYLNDNIHLTNCTIIYDHLHKGKAELLPYYYFYLLHSFDTAIILHDSVFIQSKIDFNIDEPITFLWSIPHTYNYTITNEIHELLYDLPEYESLMILYNNTDKWQGSFGVMSIIKWNILNDIVERYDIFNKLLPKIKNREYRSALERVIPLLFYHHSSSPKKYIFGNIFDYQKWGLTFSDYMINDFTSFPIIKVWTGR